MGHMVKEPFCGMHIYWGAVKELVDSQGEADNWGGGAVFGIPEEGTTERVPERKKCRTQQK